MKKLAKGILFLVCVLCFEALVGGAALFINYKMNQNVYFTEYEYESEKLPKAFDGYRIAVISDIHNSSYVDKFIDQLDAAKPDLLLFAGDMIQLPNKDLDNVIKIVESQSDKIPVYAIFGNHEASNGSKIREGFVNELSEAGARVLLNESVDIVKDKAKIQLIGIEDISDEFVNKEEIIRIRGKVQGMADDEYDEDLFRILLYHRADIYPELHDLPVDLVLSGHLHGGIVRLPFVGGVFGRGGTFFPKYTSGVYEEKNTTMIVSRGCDYNPEKPRIFNPPEVVMVTLKKD